MIKTEKKVELNFVLIYFFPRIFIFFNKSDEIKYYKLEKGE